MNFCITICLCVQRSLCQCKYVVTAFFARFRCNHTESSSKSQVQFSKHYTRQGEKKSQKTCPVSAWIIKGFYFFTFWASSHHKSTRNSSYPRFVFFSLYFSPSPSRSLSLFIHNRMPPLPVCIPPLLHLPCTNACHNCHIILNAKNARIRNGIPTHTHTALPFSRARNFHFIIRPTYPTAAQVPPSAFPYFLPPFPCSHSWHISPSLPSHFSHSCLLYTSELPTKRIV